MSYKRKRTGLEKNSLLDVGISVPRGPLGSNTRIKHKELLGDIHSALSLVNNATPFDMQDFPGGLVLNPADPVTFPWLSQIATSYQEYRFHGLYFQYTSTSGNSVAASNTALGTVIMATNYNAVQPVFTSKIQMEMTEFNNSVKPAKSCIHAIECAGHNTPLNELYIGVPSSQEDPKTYNLGTFQIATQGQQAANSTLGELHVFYDVELMKPILDISSPDSSVSVYSAHFQASDGDGQHWLGNASSAPQPPRTSSFPSGTLLFYGVNTSIPNTIQLSVGYLPVNTVILLTYVSSGAVSSPVDISGISIVASPGSGAMVANNPIFANDTASFAVVHSTTISSFQYSFIVTNPGSPSAYLTLTPTNQGTYVNNSANYIDVILTVLNPVIRT